MLSDLASFLYAALLSPQERLSTVPRLTLIITMYKLFPQHACTSSTNFDRYHGNHGAYLVVSALTVAVLNMAFGEQVKVTKI